jgi:alpha-mannosidase
MATEDIYLIHHSHTDIGYTHSPFVATELHCRFIDQALDLLDMTRDWPDGSSMRWTCESMFIVNRWLSHATSKSVDRFVSACQAGAFEVTAMWCNLTPLFDTEQLYHLAQAIEECRSLGVPIRSAMNTDVNGLPWGLVDLLLDMGITGLSMAINEYFGQAPFARPNAFRWVGPTERPLLVWNGLMYNDGRHHGIPGPIEEASRGIAGLIQQLESTDYPHSFVQFQSTYPDFSDNGPPNPELCRFVREWNRRQLAPRIQITTLSGFLSHVHDSATDIPTYRGDWPDAWGFGVGSVAHETATNRANHDRFIRTNVLQLASSDCPTLLDSVSRHLRSALHNMSLYDEHTFGADVSLESPDDPRSISDWNVKANFAHAAKAELELVERDVMIHLAQRIDHKGKPGVVAYNPSPYPVSAALQIPQHWLTPPVPMALSHLHSPTGYGQSAISTPILWAEVSELAGWGYQWIPSCQWSEQYSASDDIIATECLLESSDLRVTLDTETGGIASLIDKNQRRELVNQELGPLCNFVYESVGGDNGRNAIFDHDWRNPFVSKSSWKKDWPSVKYGGRCVGKTRIDRFPDRVSLCQTIEAENSVTLDYRYTLYALGRGLELDISINLPGTRSPHAIYLVFPFNLSRSTCRYESMGSIVNTNTDLIPDTCRDFLSVQRWIDLSDDEYGIQIVTPDLPLWMLGDISFGRLSGRVRPESTLIAWPVNNYWDTNFRASQSGKIHFSMTLVPHGPFDPASAHVRSQAVVHKPMIIPTAGQSTGSWSPKGQLLRVQADHIAPIGIRILNDGIVLVRLQSLYDTVQEARITQTYLTFMDAWRCDPVGNPITTLDLKGGTVTVSVKSREIVSVLLRVNDPGAINALGSF